MAVILIIDDDAAVRDSIHTILSVDGHEVIEAADGHKGEAEIARHQPDLVILDIFMPQQDGIETIRSLRRTHPGLKIVAISGDGDRRLGQVLTFAQEFGAHAVLAKPFRADVLRQTIGSLL